MKFATGVRWIVGALAMGLCPLGLSAQEAPGKKPDVKPAAAKAVATGHIYFSDGRGVFRIPAGGGTKVRLDSSQGGWVTGYALGQGGRRLAYTNVTRAGQTLDVVPVAVGGDPAEAQSVLEVAARIRFSNLQWSADRHTLFYYRAGANLGEGAVYRLRTKLDDGKTVAVGPPMRLTAPMVHEAHPSLDPTGHFLASALSTKQDILTRGGRPWRVNRKSALMVRQLGTGKERVLARMKQEIWAVRWSPDRRHIAFGCGRKLYVIGLAEGSKRKALMHGCISGGSLCWAPNSKQILVEAQFGKTGPGALVMVDLDGKEKFLPRPGKFVRATVSPDGQWIACSGTGGLHRIRIATGETHNLVRAPMQKREVLWR